MEFCLGLSPVARLIFVFINLRYSENEIVKYFIKLDQSNWKLIFFLCKCLCFGGLQHCTGFIYLLSFYDVLLDSTIPFHIIHIVIDKWIFLVHQLQRRRRRKKKQHKRWWNLIASSLHIYSVYLKLNGVWIMWLHIFIGRQLMTTRPIVRKSKNHSMR